MSASGVQVQEQVHGAGAAAEARPAILLDKVNKWYGAMHVLRDVSLTLRRGEILGIAGLVGAGRTELARAIVGADPIDGGEIRVRGEVVTMRSPRDAVRQRIVDPHVVDH